MQQSLRLRAHETLSRLTSAEAVAQSNFDRARDRKASLDAAQAAAEKEAVLYTKAIAVWNQAIEQTATKNLDGLLVLVNQALAAIIPDQKLSLKVVPAVKWDKQVYQFTIMHDDVERKGVDGIGGTVLAIASLVLRVMFIQQTHRANLLVLDESLRFVSKSYKARASLFVQQLADAYGMHILLITHDEELAVASRHHYAVARAGEDGSTVRRISLDDVHAYFGEGDLSKN